MESEPGFSLFDAFSSREPVSTSLENALATRGKCAGTPSAASAQGLRRFVNLCQLFHLPVVSLGDDEAEAAQHGAAVHRWSFAKRSHLCQLSPPTVAE